MAPMDTEVQLDDEAPRPLDGLGDSTDRLEGPPSSDAARRPVALCAG